MISWLIRTAWNIQFLPRAIFYPYVVSFWAWVAMFLAGRGVWSSWLIVWLVLELVYGLILFGMSWKRAGIDCPEAQFALALVLVVLIPFIALYGYALSVMAEGEENHERIG